MLGGMRGQVNEPLRYHLWHGAAQGIRRFFVSDPQFEHINRRVRQFLAKGEPVISVDTKKKELVGEFKNGGQELRPKGMPEKARVHDFVIRNWEEPFPMAPNKRVAVGHKH